MKSSWLRITAVAALVGGLCLAVAQEVPQQAPRQNRGARIVQYLNLTPSQQTQVQAEFQAVRESAQPIRQQLKQVRTSMFQAIRTNDTAKIDQLSTQQANLKGQLSAMRNEAIARVYSSLTPEQRAKADQLPGRFRQMRQRRIQNHQVPDNG